MLVRFRVRFGTSESMSGEAGQDAAAPSRLLRELTPGLHRLAVLGNAADPFTRPFVWACSRPTRRTGRYIATSRAETGGRGPQSGSSVTGSDRFRDWSEAFSSGAPSAPFRRLLWVVSGSAWACSARVCLRRTGDCRRAPQRVRFPSNDGRRPRR